MLCTAIWLKKIFDRITSFHIFIYLRLFEISNNLLYCCVNISFTVSRFLEREMTFFEVSYALICAASTYKYCFLLMLFCFQHTT